MALPTILPGTEKRDLTTASGLSSSATVSSVLLTKVGSQFCLAVTMSDATVCYFNFKNGEVRINTTATHNEWDAADHVSVTPQAV